MGAVLEVLDLMGLIWRAVSSIVGVACPILKSSGPVVRVRCPISGVAAPALSVRWVGLRGGGSVAPALLAGVAGHVRLVKGHAALGALVCLAYVHGRSDETRAGMCEPLVAPHALWST